MKWQHGFSSFSQVRLQLIFELVSDKKCILIVLFKISVVVNMILINMMMAIINLAFEEIKQNAAAYQNKFELMDYVKRTTRYVFKKITSQYYVR